MPGQDNSVCEGDTSKARNSLGGARGENDVACDRSPWPLDGRDRVPVGPCFGMAGGLILIGVPADPDAAADGDGAARDHADGLERLARAAVACAYPLAAGVRLF